MLRALLLILIPTGFLFSQNSISGMIKSNGNPVPYANILIYNATDSTNFLGTASDMDGKFEIPNINFNKGILKISALGFDSYSQEITIPSTELSIELMSKANDINEVTITATQNTITQEPGKTVLNVANSSVNANNSAYELLRKIPGVIVDNNGNITVKGRGNIMVYIDGNPTYISGNDLKKLLENTNASNIEKIEVITQPGANFDAEGNGGIINIVMKKKVAMGFNGSIEGFYGQGFYPKAGGGISLSYGRKKWNLSGSYNFNFNNGLMWITNIRPIGSSEYNQNYWASTPDYSHAGKIAFDYTFSKKVFSAINFNYNFSNGLWGARNRVEFKNAAGLIDSVQTVNDSTPYNSYNLRGNILTKVNLDTTGQHITFNLDLGTFRDNVRGKYIYDFLDPFGVSYRTSPSQRYTNSPLLYIIAGKIDYVNPHFLKMELNAGWKSSYVTNDGQVEYFNMFASGDSIITDRSNRFIYEENINAAYLILKKKIKKWSFEAGVRMEHTNTTGTQMTTGQVNKQNYVSFFPNAGIGFSPSEIHQINFIYNRRINRPDYNELNPFLYVLDNYSTYQGNPNLKPQFSHNFELSYSIFQALTFTASYSNVDNQIFDAFTIDSINPQRAIFTKTNLGNSHVFNAGVSFGMPITKWWMFFVSGNAIYNTFKDSTLNIDNSGWYGVFSTYMEFTLPKKFSIELTSYFMTGAPMNQGISQPNGDVSAGISKKLFKDKLQLTFNVSDIFRTTRWNSVSILPDGTQSRGSFWWDSRVFRFSAKFNFGGPPKRSTQKEDSIFDRVGGGRG